MNMNLFDIDKLTKSLLNEELTEVVKVRYYIATLCLQLISSAVPLYLWGMRLDAFGLISYALGAIVATLSIISICEVNKEIDNKYILERLVVLGFPAFFYGIILYWVLYFAVIFAHAILEKDMTFHIYAIVGLPFYYWYVFNKIRTALIRNKTQRTV
jgi:hypothetical protein